MEFKLYHKRQTKHNPCVVEFSERLKVFYVGCYTLAEIEAHNTTAELRDQNNRLGSLFISEICPINKRKSEFSLKLGGVFDLRILSIGSHLTNEADVEWIGLAHASGQLGIYRYDRKLSTLQVNKTFSGPREPSILLTSLEKVWLAYGKHLFLFTGDSNGEIRAFQMDKVIDQGTTQLIETNQTILSSTTEFNHPIWYIKSAKINFGALSYVVILVGSDDSKWRLYAIDCQSDEFILNKLYTNKDAGAGVTSFELLTEPQMSTTSNGVDSCDFIFLAGSYDETLRIYQLSMILETDAVGESQLKVADCQQKKTIKIDGSGIWRIKKLPRGSNFLISGMYAGSYMLSWNEQPPEVSLDYKLSRIDAKSKDMESDDKEDKELIYDTACDEHMRLFVCVSFYNRVIYCYRKL